MIPKVIHYCWFGRGQMPQLAQTCMESWGKYLPDYKLKLWDEDSFDINSVPYVKEAYQSRKFAFVTDYVRLYALFNEGGIYMDTDVEVLKSFDDLLYLPAFSGYESNKFSSFPTGIMASEKAGVWVKEQLVYYKDIHFIKSDGGYDMTTNTQTISRIMAENGFELNGKYQIYKNDMYCFPKDYFCPMTSTRVLKLTKNSYCIHHFAGSWQIPTIWGNIKLFIFRKIIGLNNTDKLINIKRKLLAKK
jgi:mannosyltransferase OCH1-like enzyme